MLNRIPRSIPPLSMMLDDLGRPRTAALARALDVSPSTARRWIAADHAPRTVLIGLFWLTSWGRSAVDCEAHNAAVLHATHAASPLLHPLDAGGSNPLRALPFRAATPCIAAGPQLFRRGDLMSGVAEDEVASAGDAGGMRSSIDRMVSASASALFATAGWLASVSSRDVASN
jgi:hypothetical protein